MLLTVYIREILSEYNINSFIAWFYFSKNTGVFHVCVSILSNNFKNNLIHYLNIVIKVI